MSLINLIFIIPALLVIVDFLHFLLTSKSLYPSTFNIVLEMIVIVGVPIISASTFQENYYYPFIYIFLILVYTYSRYNKSPLSPLLEIAKNSILLIGIVIFSFGIFREQNSLIIFFMYSSMSILFTIQLINCCKKPLVLISLTLKKSIIP